MRKQRLARQWNQRAFALSAHFTKTPIEDDFSSAFLFDISKVETRLTRIQILS